MMSLYRRCNVLDVILNGKGRNSVEQNAIVNDNSDRSLLRHRAPLLQSPNVVNQWISKDLSCDALMSDMISLYKINTLSSVFVRTWSVSSNVRFLMSELICSTISRLPRCLAYLVSVPRCLAYLVSVRTWSVSSNVRFRMSELICSTISRLPRCLAYLVSVPRCLAYLVSVPRCLAYLVSVPRCLAYLVSVPRCLAYFVSVPRCLAYFVSVRTWSVSSNVRFRMSELICSTISRLPRCLAYLCVCTEVFGVPCVCTYLVSLQ